MKGVDRCSDCGLLELEDGSSSFDLNFFTLIGILTNLLSRNSVLSMLLAWFHPNLVGHSREDHLVVSVCALNSWILVLRAI